MAAMKAAGLLADPTLWLQFPLGEDAIVALGAAAVEFGLEKIIKPTSGNTVDRVER